MANTNLKMEGKLAVEIPDKELLQEFCKKHIPSYDATRFELVALRLYNGPSLIVTVYAADKSSHKTVRELRYPVKKFKLEKVPTGDLLFLSRQFNFTLSVPHYDLDDMDVTNR
jgi:hypothetical protein